MKRTLILVLALIAVATGAYADRKPYTRNVAIVVYKDAEPLDWTGPYEVWHDAASFGSFHNEEAFHIYLVSKTKAQLSSQGMQIVPDYSIADAPKPDVVIIPGGDSSQVTGDPEFMAWVSSATRDAEVVQTVCTGAFVAAKAGLLDNMEVTTWYGAIGRMRELYPNLNVKDGRRFIDNGRVVTTAGVSAGIDGSLHVVARLLGRNIADQVARYMEYHWSPEPYLAREYQSLNPSTDAAGRALQAAMIKVHDKDYASAIGDLRSIVAANPGETDAWRSLAESLSATGRHADAADAYVKFAPVSHMPEYVYFLAAREYAAAEKKDNAVASLRKAFDAGYRDRDAALKDPAFKGIDVAALVK